MNQTLKSLLGYLLIVVALGGLIFYVLIMPSQDETMKNASAQSVFHASFPDMNGQLQSLQTYKGKIVILNFWATWCEPCREEMPALSALNQNLQKKEGIVLGLAIDDMSAIKTFASETPVSYPLFAAEGEGMELASALGNNKGVLPYTVIIRPDGKIHATFFGRVTQALIEKSLQELPSS